MSSKLFTHNRKWIPVLEQTRMKGPIPRKATTHPSSFRPLKERDANSTSSNATTSATVAGQQSAENDKVPWAKEEPEEDFYSVLEDNPEYMVPAPPRVLKRVVTDGGGGDADWKHKAIRAEVELANTERAMTAATFKHSNEYAELDLELQKTLTLVDKQAAALEAKQKEIDSLKLKATKTKEERKDLQLSFQEMEEKIKGLTSKVSSLEESIAWKNRDLERAALENREMQTEINDVMEEGYWMERELEEVRNQCKNWQREINSRDEEDRVAERKMKEVAKEFYDLLEAKKYYEEKWIASEREKGEISSTLRERDAMIGETNSVEDN